MKGCDFMLKRIIAFVCCLCLFFSCFNASAAALSGLPDFTVSQEDWNENWNETGNVNTNVCLTPGKNETELLSSIPLQFKCRCSKEIVLSTLKLIDKAEIEDIIKKDKSCEISCAFCEKKYHFDEEELISLLS